MANIFTRFLDNFRRKPKEQAQEEPKEIKNFWKNENGGYTIARTVFRSWDTNDLAPETKKSVEWLLENGFSQESDVREAFQDYETSEMSDDAKATKRAEKEFIRLFEYYKQPSYTIPSQVKGWKDTQTRDVARDIREPLEFLIKNDYLQYTEVKNALYDWQTSEMADDIAQAEKQAKDKIKDIYKRYVAFQLKQESREIFEYAFYEQEINDEGDMAFGIKTIANNGQTRTVISSDDKNDLLKEFEILKKLDFYKNTEFKEVRLEELIKHSIEQAKTNEAIDLASFKNASEPFYNNIADRQLESCKE